MILLDSNSPIFFFIFLNTTSENITREDLSTISPFGNTADIIEIKGKYLKEAFEHGFSGMENNEGRFPQVSGMGNYFFVMFEKRILKMNIISYKFFRF